MKKIISLLLILVLTLPALAQEVIPEYNNETISALNEELRSLDIDTQIKENSGLDLYNNTIENVATPVNSTDAATKQYVDDSITAITGLLGAWVDKSSSYAAQQAATDGFVVAISDGGNYIQGYSDSNTNPTTLRGYGNAANSSIAFPVRKGDYWKIVVGVGSPTVYWIPLGS